MDEELQRITLIMDDGAFTSAAGRGASAVDQIVTGLDKLDKKSGLDKAAAGAAKVASGLEDAAAAAAKLDSELSKTSAKAGKKRAVKGPVIGEPDDALDAAERSWIRKSERFVDRVARRQEKQIEKGIADVTKRANFVPRELMPRAQEKRMSAAGRAFQALTKRIGPGAVRGIGDAAQQFDEFAPVLARIAPAAGMAAAGVAALSALVGVAAVKFGASVVDAQAFREDVRSGLTTILRSQVEADKAMRMAAETAGMVGQNVVETSGQFLDLLAKGFDTKMVDRIVRSLADLATVDPKASIEGLTKVIGKAQATGRINMDILSELSTFGLEQGDVIREIGKLLKKTDAETIKALSSAGGIRGLGVEPILAAISKQVGGGPAGAAAQKKARENISGLVRQIKSIPENVLFDLAVGPGMADVKGAAAEIVEFFRAGTESGERVRKVLSGVFNALAQGFFGRDISKGGGLKAGLEGVVDIVEQATPAIKEGAATVRQLASGFGTLVGFIGKISSLGEKFGGLFSILNMAAKPIRILASAFAGPMAILPELAGIIGGITSAFEGLWDAIGGASIADGLSSVWDSITSAASTAWESATSFGSNIIDGMIAGLQAGAMRLVASVRGIATSAITTAKDVLGIASPSKEFWSIGSNVANSFADSMATETPSAELSAAAMAARSVAAANDVAPAAMATSAAPAGIAAPTTGSGIVIQQLTIQVNGARDAADARAQGEAAADGFSRRLGAELRVRQLRGAA